MRYAEGEKSDKGGDVFGSDDALAMLEDYQMR
jgi:hypothetical protein